MNFVLRHSIARISLNSRHLQFRYLSNKSAVITKIHRSLYLKQYQTLLVEPDGSTYTIRHYEPQKIIKLPLDITQLSAEEREKHLANRKPKPKATEEEIQDDNFSSKKYLRLLKKS